MIVFLTADLIGGNDWEMDCDVEMDWNLEMNSLGLAGRDVYMYIYRCNSLSLETHNFLLHSSQPLLTR